MMRGARANLSAGNASDAVADVLRAAAAKTPLLVVLDDVHDAQESSIWRPLSR